MSYKEIYDIGELPPIGHVPKRMYGQLIRADRFGDPTQAFQTEQVDVPKIKPDEVLVYVMAAGINYNNVWAAQGKPVSVFPYGDHPGGGITSAAPTPPESCGRSAPVSRAGSRGTRS